MDDPTNPAAPRWSASPSAKARNAVQREVMALLDELAPEKVLTRGETLRLPVEQHRSPTGCVLQSPAAAVSVSWFADATHETTLGELHIVVWQGVLSRRGAARKTEGATIVQELVFYPVERAENAAAWRAPDGTLHTSPSLAARCLALLEEQRAGPS